SPKNQIDFKLKSTLKPVKLRCAANFLTGFCSDFSGSQHTICMHSSPEKSLRLVYDPPATDCLAI
ncbi:MAG: hypothetical protein U9Q84_00875, partial [Thermodesulfobacteriota bacterium]|nr:hypothetical protein [Thermodesulfobacteriota bacterium]